jgi:adenosylcobinamide-GDP ribazoletransferase
MSLRGLWLATQFLTRVPVPRVADFSSRDLSRSALWFPVVGIGVGFLVISITLLTRQQNGLLAASLGVLGWAWLTGALHLDGLADLVDALAASHRNPERFLPVLADPHLGACGGVSIVLVLIVKTAALAQLPSSALWIALWGALLLAASAALSPLLCVAPLVLAAWGTWLRVRLGGVTGDCLGAGVEVSETVLLVGLAVMNGAHHPFASST